MLYFLGEHNNNQANTIIKDTVDGFEISWPSSAPRVPRCPHRHATHQAMDLGRVPRQCVNSCNSADCDGTCRYCPPRSQVCNLGCCKHGRPFTPGYELPSPLQTVPHKRALVDASGEENSCMLFSIIIAVQHVHARLGTKPLDTWPNTASEFRKLLATSLCSEESMVFYGSHVAVNHDSAWLSSGCCMSWVRVRVLSTWCSRLALCCAHHLSHCRRC